MRAAPVVTNDLTAQLNKNKKFQMLKKLKEEKERKRQMVVRDIKKVNRPKSGSKKSKPPAIPDDDAERWFEEEPL